VPGAWTLLDGAPLKVWAADVVAGEGAPGTVLAAQGDGIRVACGRAGLALREVQPAGGKRMSAAAFLAGRALAPGTRLDGGAGA
jgi:methionyl-tRNA formyltransferase